MPDVFMPRLSDTMEEGTIAQWLKSEGDDVQRGDILAEIETDKAVMDLEAYETGVLEKIVIEPGNTVPIGETIAIIGDGSGSGSGGADGVSASADKAPGKGSSKPSKDAADAQHGGDEARADSSEPGESDSSDAASDSAPDSDDSGEVDDAGDEAVAESANRDAPATPTGGHQLKASPVVRSLARTNGIDLSAVSGTGPGGRIIRVDVEKLLGESGSGQAASGKSGTSSSASAGQSAAPQALASASAGTEEERVPLSTIRKVAAKRLSEATLVPAFQLTTVLDATKLTDLRREVNASLAESGGKVSVTDLLVKAAAITLRAHPEANAAFDGDAIIRRGHVNVGIAVALEDGLIVPVVKDADRKALSEIGREAKDLAKRARAGKLSPDEFSGGTFTISNLGMFGIDNFTAVLNPPEAAILAVGSTVDEPVVIDGEVQVRARTRLTLTVDHRVLDGAMGAAFLKDLTELLTEPMRILV